MHHAFSLKSAACLKSWPYLFLPCDLEGEVSAMLFFLSSSKFFSVSSFSFWSCPCYCTSASLGGPQPINTMWSSLGPSSTYTFTVHNRPPDPSSALLLNFPTNLIPLLFLSPTSPSVSYPPLPLPDFLPRPLLPLPHLTRSKFSHGMQHAFLSKSLS